MMADWLPLRAVFALALAAARPLRPLPAIVSFPAESRHSASTAGTALCAPYPPLAIPAVIDGNRKFSQDFSGRFVLAPLDRRSAINQRCRRLARRCSWLGFVRTMCHANCQNPLYRPQEYIRLEDGSPAEMLAFRFGAANRDLWLPIPLKRCDLALRLVKIWRKPRQ